jgi:transposase
MSDELLTLKAAGDLVGKSASTIRRWVRAGKLTRHEGVQVSGGGSPPVMIEKYQLLTFVGTTTPLQPTVEVSTTGVQLGSRSGVQLSTERAVRVAELEGEVSTLKARLDSCMETLERERTASETQVRNLLQQLFEARSDLVDWRERHDAVTSEMKALSGRSWWRRMLPGPKD